MSCFPFLVVVGHAGVFTGFPPPPLLRHLVSLGGPPEVGAHLGGGYFFLQFLYIGFERVIFLAHRAVPSSIRGTHFSELVFSGRDPLLKVLSRIRIVSALCRRFVSLFSLDPHSLFFSLRGIELSVFHGHIVSPPTAA